MHWSVKMTERDTQLTCVKFHALIYKIEGYMNILHMHSFFFLLVYDGFYKREYTFLLHSTRRVSIRS